MKQTISDICNTIIHKGYKIILISGNGASGKSAKERIEMRYEQFELFVLPLADKFDLRLISQNDFSYILQ